MLLFIKHAVITLSVLVGFFSALIGVVAYISQGMSDNEGDDTGRIISFTSLCVLAICILLVLLLSGCSTGKALFDACRDGLCR